MTVRKQLYLFIASLMMTTPGLWAYDVLIKPVDIDLRIYPGVIRATVDTNKCFWFAEVLGLEKPPDQWTDAHKEEIKKYFDDHFQLSVGGKRLEGQVQDVRYSEGFWQPYSLEARLTFQVSYAVPRSGGILKGRAVFFQEDWAAEKKEAEAAHQTVDSHEYETHLHIYGKKPTVLTLTMEKPDFEFPLAAILRSAWQARTDALWNFIKRDLSGLIIFLVAALIVFRYRDHFY
jgi:hypothetical protein